MVKSDKLKILYLDDAKFFQKPLRSDKFPIHYIFPRISNYLNSRKKELGHAIEEELVLLSLEISDHVDSELSYENYYTERWLESFYQKYPFDVIAISCYGTGDYNQSIQIANIVKYQINKNILIVVGGRHPTSVPEDFFLDKLPPFLKYHRNDFNPIDYIVRGEGELPFFLVIEDIIKRRKDTTKDGIEMETPIILDNSSGIYDLDPNDLPLLDLGLLEKYASVLKDKKCLFHLDMTRGCPFECSFCSNSECSTKSRKRIRYKTLDKCIHELEYLMDFQMGKGKRIFLFDPLFLPKRSLRREFYNLLKNLRNKKSRQDIDLVIFDRIDFVKEEDLKQWRILGINAFIGLEHVSTHALRLMNKTYNPNNNTLRNYISNAEFIIKKNFEIGANNIFALMYGFPGETKEDIQDLTTFLCEKRYDGKTIVEKYPFSIYPAKYKAYPDNKMYYECETFYGGHIYCREWWKSQKNNDSHCRFIDPSENLSFLESLQLNFQWFHKYLKIILRKKDFEHLYWTKRQLKLLTIPIFWETTKIFKNTYIKKEKSDSPLRLKEELLV